MDFTGTDSHFRAESVAETVSKPRGAVLIYTGRIHKLHKGQRSVPVLCDNAVCVMGAEPVNVFHCFLYTVHQFHR